MLWGPSSSIGTLCGQWFLGQGGGEAVSDVAWWEVSEALTVQVSCSIGLPASLPVLLTLLDGLTSHLDREEGGC